MGGIYRIRNLQNNKLYIGSTQNFHERKVHHFTALRKGNHHSILLQRAFNKYGEDSFVFEIIEECDDKELLEREQYYLDTLLPYAPDGYNVSHGATNCILNGEQNGMFGKRGRDNPNFGRKNSPETIKRMSEAQKGIPKSLESIEKMKRTKRFQYDNGKESSFKNHHHTEATKKTLSEQHSVPVKQIDKDTGEVLNIFASALEAYQLTGVQNSPIGRCCKHELHYNTAGGYKWEYATKEEYLKFEKEKSS